MENVKIGMLFGCDLLLATDNPEITGKAEKFLERKTNHRCETVEQEMMRLYPKRELPFMARLLNVVIGKPTPIKE